MHTKNESVISLSSEAPILVQAHVIIVEDTVVVVASDGPDLVQANILVINDSLLPVTSGNASLWVEGMGFLKTFTATVEDQYFESGTEDHYFIGNIP